MKLEMESKKAEDPDMGVTNQSDSQHTDSQQDNSILNISEASTSLSKAVDNQSNKMLTENFFSISKEEKLVKQEDPELLATDILVLQNTDSKSEDCIVTSTIESSSPESQKNEFEEAVKVEESVISMADLNNDAALKSQLSSYENDFIQILSEENPSDTEESISALNIANSKNHRENVHYISDSSDYETEESSDSSDCDEFFDNLRKSVEPAKLPVLKTKGELLIEDLPPVEDLHITVNSTELLKIGGVLHCVVAEERNEFLVVVESDGNSNPLDEDSVLFLSWDKPLGMIHDVFGNVSKPNYIVRFNKAEDIFNKGVTPGQIVYYSPANGELTRYVLVDVLKQQKGSDASWKDNNEPPDDEIDYSDDEQEKLAKQKRRAKTRGKERNWEAVERDEVAPNKMERRDASYSQQRVFKRASRNMLHSPMPSPSRSLPRSYSPQNFGPTPPPSENFGSSNLPRNSTSPQTFGYTPSNSIPFRPFLQRNSPSPQPSRQFPHVNVQSPQPFGPFPPSNLSSHQSFGHLPQSSVSTYQPFTAPPTSYVLASSSPALSHVTSALQHNPSSFMAAPQNNVPLQQQLMLQSQQTLSSFLSRPPPNFNSQQNSRNFLHQPQSFTPPVFGALPAARPAMQNTSNQLPVNQMLFSSGTNAPHISLSGNSNIYQSTNIVPTNSNGHQGQSYGMVQSNSSNSFFLPQFPPRNTQHNSVHSPVTQQVLASIPLSRSPLPPPPCPTPPFVPCQTPPPPVLPNQTILSNAHPQILQNQHNLPIFSRVQLPVLPSQTPPPMVQVCTIQVPGNPMFSQNQPF